MTGNRQFQTVMLGAGAEKARARTDLCADLPSYTVLNARQEGASSASAADYRRVRDVLARCEAMPTEKDKAAFGAKNLEQDLGRLLRDATIEQHRNVLDRPLAKSALAGALHAAGSSRTCAAAPRHLLTTLITLHPLTRRDDDEERAEAVGAAIQLLQRNQRGT